MPTYRDRPPVYGGGGYGPSAVTDILMHRGAAQADAEARSGAVWADTLSGIGQSLAGGIQQAAEGHQLAKRDAAWVKYIESGEWAQDPKAALANSVRMWGPQDGPKQFQALQGAAQLMQEKRDPEQDRKSLGAIIGAADRLTDDGRAYMWPQLVSLGKRVYPELQIDEEYTPEVWSMVSALGPDLRGDKPKEPIKGRPGDVFLDPNDPSKQLAAIPPEAPTPQGFTLSPGEVRYGADGQPIAQRPPAPDKPSKDKFWVIRDGKPIRVSDAEYRPGDQPASNREQGRPVTSGDSTTIADFDTSLDDLNELGRTLSGTKATGTSAKVGAILPNAITEMTGWGTDAKQKQATIDRVKQVIGKALEGGVLRKEDESKYEKILPTIADPPEVVKTKLAGLWKAITQRRQTFLDSKSDAGYDVAKFSGRTPKQKEFGDDGDEIVTTPDGKKWKVVDGLYVQQ